MWGTNCLSFALFFQVTDVALQKRILSSYFGNIAYAYLDYGFPYCLGVTLLDTGISEPNGYSEELMKEMELKEGEEMTEEEVADMIDYHYREEIESWISYYALPATGPDDQDEE